VGKFVLSPEALDDLDLIWLHIATDNPRSADEVIESAYRICNLLADHPELGPVRNFPGRNPTGIRYFVITDFPNYLIFYRTLSAGVEIVRVLHAAQDIDSLFVG
jgi:toxin ParE1/3/4